jgi:hypothetical protein
MAAKPAEPEQPGAEPGRHREPEQADEHTGPVAVTRHLKSDGRALILYTRDGPPPAA